MPSQEAKRQTRRLDPLALFEDLGYQPHPGQLLVHQSKAPRRVLACGSRWGKSLCAAMEAVAALLEPREECRGWIVAPTRDLGDRIFLKVANTLKTHVDHRILELDLRGQRIVISNLGGGTSELRGKSADMPVTLLGEELDFLVVDEAAKLRDDIWESYLAARLVNRKGWALFLSTPAGTNWLYRAFRRGQKRRDPQYESWQSPTLTNPHVDPSVIEDERSRSSKDAFEEQYEARFLGAQIEPCDTCGGPSPTAAGVAFVMDDDLIPLCPECGKAVDEKGRTVWRLNPNGQPALTVIHFEGGDEDESPPALPSRPVPGRTSR